MSRTEDAPGSTPHDSDRCARRAQAPEFGQPLTRRRVAATGDASLIWEGQRAGRDIGYCHLEKLSNLEALPADGFLVVCFPVKVRRGSAGWTRAVAILEE